MANPQLRVILNDNDGSITYGGGNWPVSNAVQWYGGSCQYPQFANDASGIFGSFSLTFEGTSIAFIGNTPSPESSQNITVSIDGGAPYNTSYDAPPGRQFYVQWYQSPLLPDGPHTILVDNVDGTALDMALVTVGPNTPPANRTIFVDDDDPAIQYTGKWTRDGSEFKPISGFPGGLPIGNTTQRSTTVGDTMTFPFSGTTIAVYGILSWTNVGNIIAAYTLDGTTETYFYNISKTSPQHKSAAGDSPNYPLFARGGLLPGNHTLVLNITGIQSQTFIFDYIVYGTMLDPAPGGGGPSAPIETGASTRSPGAIATQTGVAGNSGQGGSDGAIPVNIGAVVGGNISIVVLFAVVVATFILYRRKRRFTAQHRAQTQIVPENWVHFRHR